MTGAFLCEQCKSRSPRSARSTPSTGNRAGPKRKCPEKPIDVAAEPSDQTCIVVGSKPGSSCNGAGGRGGAGGISLRFLSSTNKLRVSMPDLSKTDCIQIVGNSIIKTSNGGLQIVPCKAKGGGGLQISVARSGGGGSGGVSGNLQLSFGKGKCGNPSITYEPGGNEMEITYGPQKRKLNMNHCKPTIASMIHKKIVELETEKKLADCSRNDLHHK